MKEVEKPLGILRSSGFAARLINVRNFYRSSEFIKAEKIDIFLYPLLLLIFRSIY
ncbi:MAG: hypothetical protein ACLFTQ_03040 [Candidatus Aenigmatarchaeota archaeon]